MDELKHLHTEGLKDIEIPDGLEDRLSMMIDQLEENVECAAKVTVTLPAKPARKPISQAIPKLSPKAFLLRKKSGIRRRFSEAAPVLSF